ncbi:MAG: hypothetical protein ACPIOQ_37955 [Promethearchaeia archaeon]
MHTLHFHAQLPTLSHTDMFVAGNVAFAAQVGSGTWKDLAIDDRSRYERGRMKPLLRQMQYVVEQRCASVCECGHSM